MSNPKWYSIDIETDFGGKNARKMLNLGWCSSKTSDFGEEHFFWQDEKYLYYPNDADLKYTGILKIWRPAKKTKMADALRKFLADVAGKVVVGWNIKNFDIPIIRAAIKKHLDIDWKPMYFDGYLELKQYVKDHPHLEKYLKRVNGLTKSGKFASMTAESMYKYVTGSFGYREYHTALYDAQDERHLIKMMSQKWNLSPNKLAKKYEGK